MLLKGAVRRRQVSKTRCLAERCHGESPEACIALRGTPPLTYLACDVSERAETSIIDGRSRVTHSTGCQWYGDGAGQPGFTLQTISGAAESGWGIEQHATYSISFESYGVNTGDLRKDAKAGGSRKARAV
jgi:hypothetical protein